MVKLRKGEWHHLLAEWVGWTSLMQGLQRSRGGLSMLWCSCEPNKVNKLCSSGELPHPVLVVDSDFPDDFFEVKGVFQLHVTHVRAMHE